MIRLRLLLVFLPAVAISQGTSEQRTKRRIPLPGSTVVTVVRETPLLAARSAKARRLRMLPHGLRLHFENAPQSRDGFLPVVVESDAGYVALKDVAVSVEPEVIASPRLDSVTVTRVDSFFIEPPLPAIPDELTFDPPPNAAFMTFQRGPFDVILLDDMRYKIGSTLDTIIVPSGFVTDFASIPHQLWSRLPPTGEYKLAAVVHDYLYWEQPCTRLQSDNLLYIAMKEQDVPYEDRAAVWVGVRVGGQGAWDHNAAEKRSRLLKFIPKDLRHPDGNTSWPIYRSQLMKRGLMGDSSHASPRPAYCALGDSRDVP